MWLIDAAWLLRKRIASDGIRAGARAPTDLFVLADTAFAFKAVGVAQRLEDIRFAVNLA